MDSVGLNDMNPIHRAQMRQQEGEADMMLVMHENDLSANEQVVSYLQGSEFLQRWRAHAVDGDLNERPRQLGFMLYTWVLRAL